MRVTDFLDESNVKYEVTEHRPSFSAQRMAAEEHEPGDAVRRNVSGGAEFLLIPIHLQTSFLPTVLVLSVPRQPHLPSLDYG